MFEKIQNTLERRVAPIAGKLNSSDLIKSLSKGMMYTMPITLGVCLLAILVYLPVDGWQTFLSSTNLGPVCVELLTVTMNLLALYIVISIAYNYGIAKGVNGITSAIVTLGVFISLIPLNANVGERSTTYSIDTSYLGSNGIFMAILLGLAVSGLFAWLMKRIAIKLPESVPTMVTDSLSPTFVAIIIFSLTFALKWALSFTSHGDLFDLVNEVLATPIMNVGSSPWAIILAYSFSGFLWFFGVHPSAIMNVFSPAISVTMLGNLEAFMSGTPASELPHLAFITIYAVMSIGGSGNMLGLALSMATAKSARYKTMFKLAFIPSLFNISEPMMFGTPVVMNPVFFIPMVLSTPVVGFIGWGLATLGLNNSLNPAVVSPWVLPKFIAGFMSGGWRLMVIVLICMVVATLMYLPFFKIADRQALLAEQEDLAAQEKLTVE